nr:MgtC/SapB family protein [Tissierella sp.]
MNEGVTIVLRLILSAVLGGAVGFEREVHNRPAGFRTHILVTIGSTLIMLVSTSMGPNADPARLAAQVVSGIGFLGAGTILRTGNNVEGLTTAASLWVCSAIGLAMGSGFYLGGIVVTVIVLFFLEKVSTFERFINRENYKSITIRGKTRPGFIGDIGTAFGMHHIIIKNISIENIEIKEDLNEEVLFKLKFPVHLDIELLIQQLYEIEGIKEVMVDDKVMEKY